MRLGHRNFSSVPRSPGIRVHRLDVHDACAAGVPMYHPKTREKISPEESRRLAFDKTAWDRNYALRFIRGGVAACSLCNRDQLFSVERVPL